MLPRFRNRLRWKETNVKKLATILMLISLATGCTVGPNYKRPSVDVPGGFRGAAPSADGAQSGTQSGEKKPEQQPGQSAAQPSQSAAQLDRRREMVGGFSGSAAAGTDPNCPQE